MSASRKAKVDSFSPEILGKEHFAVFVRIRAARVKEGGKDCKLQEFSNKGQHVLVRSSHNRKEECFTLYRPARYVPGWPSHWSRDVVLSCFEGLIFLPQRNRSEGTWALSAENVVVWCVSTGAVTMVVILPKLGWDAVFQILGCQQDANYM
ncbi:hypothetical protein AVEN_244101-1 [Araneus ventricosus]|uniref:Uncharacterized protein n=1 Tax=Araneus ventricosus TaxID=182803 RepID=A0A4Y2IJ58_ARAVE|nr:hypothetical protein AVEN_244101-1 [Araneus ventricosus]